MPLFEMPELLTLDGNPFSSMLDYVLGPGTGCSGGCTDGCCTGCIGGTGKGVAPKPPVG